MKGDNTSNGVNEKSASLGLLTGAFEINKTNATGNRNGINPYSKPSKMTPCVKPLKRDNLRNKNESNNLLFFEDWQINPSKVEEDLAEYFNCTDYDPVDHVSILLDNCTLDERAHMKGGYDENGKKTKPHDSVWQRRRRALVLEKGLSTGIDSVLSKNNAIDNDGFLVIRRRSFSHSYNSARQGESGANRIDLTKDWITFS